MVKKKSIDIYKLHKKVRNSLRTFFMTRILVFLAVLSAFFGSMKGNAQLRDSLSSALHLKPSFYGSYGSQYSFVSNRFATVSNLRAGIDFGGVVKFGIGYNWLTRDYPEFNKEFNDRTQYTRFHMNYFSLFGEYAFYRTYRWEATIPAQVGFGLAHYSFDVNGTRKHQPKKFFAVYEPLMTIQYRFLRYLGIGCGIGYRLIIINRTVITEQLFSPVMVIKSKVFLGDLWRDIHKKRPH
jgi:hypothetical protein